jgi:hypothetical protein
VNEKKKEEEKEKEEEKRRLTRPTWVKLYKSAFFLFRRTDDDNILNSKGIQIPKDGSSVEFIVDIL